VSPFDEPDCPPLRGARLAGEVLDDAHLNPLRLRAWLDAPVKVPTATAGRLAHMFVDLQRAAAERSATKLNKTADRLDLHSANLTEFVA
jgi:hypothetical protein